MTDSLDVHFLPSLIRPGELSGSLVVVVDVLRASTTIVHALAAGARAVVPCLEIEEAKAVRTRLGPETLLGGERGGLKIEGFDLSNSPADYTRHAVSGRTIAFTTTNGTRALAQAREASVVIIGCFANREAVLRRLMDWRGPVHIICAGTDGEITREDVLFAGCVTGDLLSAAPRQPAINDSALIALGVWESVEVLPLRFGLLPETSGSRLAETDWLAEALLLSRGGQNLARLGLASDVSIAARFAGDVLPLLDAASWELRSDPNLPPAR